MAATLTAAWAALGRNDPHALALVEAATGRVWTRAQLTARAESWRTVLPASVAGQRVAFALPNGPDWFAAFLGLLLAEAVPVPLDSSEPASAQRLLAAAAHASFALIGDHLEPIQNNPIGYFDPASCLVKLTSGSTGAPRPLAFTHTQMLADGRQVCASMGITADDLNFAVIPFGHSYGLGNLVIPLLAQGTPIICASVPLPHALAADITRWRPTVFPAVPALLRVLASADLPPDALAPLRTVISAGAPLTPEIARSFHAKFFLAPHGFYGSSETGGLTYDRTGEATLAGRSVGPPLDGVTLTLSLTPAQGQRFLAASPAVFGTGSFSPPDLATVNDLGELVLHGRTGRTVKIAGRRLDLADLEQLFRTVPGVLDAFIAPHPQTPEELAAVVATPLTAAELRARLHAHLASWKMPRRLVLLPEFPLTPRGKPDTQALHALLTR